MEHRGAPRLRLGRRRSPRLRARLRALGSLATVLALTVSGLAIGAVVAPGASAAPGPVETPADNVVTAEALPTVQINGVVWSQAIVGNKVFAGGNFTRARPAGAAPGTQETTRTHLLAYDLTTGKLDESFAPALNGQVRALTTSPDGRYLYVGGDFTTINGSTRNRIAKFDVSKSPATLVTGFLGSLDYSVYAIAATDSKIYLGGDFNSARGVARRKLAAFNTDGALLGWNPGADRKVNGLVLSPDGTRVIVGGAFGVLAGRASYGSGAVDATSGAAGTWNANKTIRNYGDKAAITSVSTDGIFVYATGYVYNGTGNLEGAFSADPKNGNIKWLQDCHGDTYGSYAPRGSKYNVVYAVSHAHFCGNVGGQPQTDPWTYQRAMAFTKDTTGTLSNNGDGAYANFAGAASPSVINWFPLVALGTFTGQEQGPWTVTGNGEYVLLGGEFPRVNGVAQQGLVRFAVKSISKGTPPVLSGGNMVPSIQSIGGGTARVSVTTNWDRDDSLLTYQLLRDGQVVNSATASSTFWNRPKVTVTDTGLTSGTTYSYQIRTVDSGGNTAVGSPVSFRATASTAKNSDYARLVALQGASPYWRLGEVSGTVYDWAGTNDGTMGAGVTRKQAGAILADSNYAVQFNGDTTGFMSSRTALNGPQIYSAEAWIKTTTQRGGKILGFGTSASGTSGSYDRHIYMSNSGQLLFGNYAGAVKAITSPKSYNDGQWHQVVGTLSRAGMVLYVDGVKVAQDTSVRSAQAYRGYWRVGGDSLDAWPNLPSNRYFNGTIDEVSIYPSALTDQQVLDQYVAARGVPNGTPTAAFTATNVERAVTLDASASKDPDGTITSYAWDYGDGQTGTGVQSAHTYAADGTYTIKLTVTDNGGATATATKSVTVAANKPPTAQFTAVATDLTAAFDATKSKDPDGTIATYAWDFGDGASGNTATASHSYAAAGTYQVTLTVTDNAGAATPVTRPVTVGAAAVAADAFGRTVASSFGTADIGGAWTSSGVASNFAVNGSVGTITMASRGSGPAAYLNSISPTDLDLVADFSVDKISDGGGINISLAARHSGTTDYRLVTRVMPDGTIGLQPVKIVNGVQTNIAGTTWVPGLTYTAGQPLRVRFQVSGANPSTLSGKAWKVGDPEPTSWQVSAADTQAELQGGGGVGVVTFLSSASTVAPVVASFDNLTVRAVQ